MILELKGTKVTIVDKTLGYQGDNLVDTIQVTVDKDSTWNYKLDMYKGKSKRFDSVLMVREGNICTVQLTNEILSYGGRYVFQLRGYTDTQTYHSDIFESWVNASIEYQDDCKQGDCGCDCKLPTEFYQVEDNVTEINNHPPYPGDNNKWMIWDVNKHEYVESDIEVVGGGGGDYQTKANLTTSITAESTNEQYPSAKATYDYGQSIAQSAGKINAITVNGTAQTVEDKTAKIIVNKSTVGLGNVNNTSDNDKPVSSAQASAIADAKQAGTTAQANLDAHISNKENPHEVTKAQVGLGDVDNTSDVNKPISTATQTALNGKLDKTAVVDVTVEATKGQAADAKSVYDTIQALPTGTDISLGVTGASVGDIVKVKAVDASGKPTAWEAAGRKPKFAVIADVTTTEATAYIGAELEHDFFKLGCAIFTDDGSVLTVDSKGEAVSGRIAMLIDTTSFKFTARKVVAAFTNTAQWQQRAMLAEWSADLSAFEFACSWDVANGQNKNLIVLNGGDSTLWGIKQTSESNAPTKGKTVYISAENNFIKTGVHTVLWGEYYE